MDNIKQELKVAKTTEQVEKKAIIYEQAVSDFDQQAGKVINLLEQLPTIKQTHQVCVSTINSFPILFRKISWSISMCCANTTMTSSRICVWFRIETRLFVSQISLSKEQ
jgi:hypothetical protein